MRCLKTKPRKGGRPNCDVIVMFKILILQQWYGLSDLEVERQIADRLSFMEFLGYPDPFPDSRTIWLFRERMAKTETDKIVWEELQRQLDAKGLKVKRGTIQDATFIEADPGSSKKPRGDEAKTRRSRDGTWAKKGDETHFGYKLHQKTDIDYGLMREIETTTASLHDSQIDLSAENEMSHLLSLNRLQASLSHICESPHPVSCRCEQRTGMNDSCLLRGHLQFRFPSIAQGLTSPLNRL